MEVKLQLTILQPRFNAFNSIDSNILHGRGKKRERTYACHMWVFWMYKMRMTCSSFHKFRLPIYGSPISRFKITPLISYKFLFVNKLVPYRIRTVNF